jgi:hypothetical protein
MMFSGSKQNIYPTPHPAYSFSGNDIDLAQNLINKSFVYTAKDIVNIEEQINEAVKILVLAIQYIARNAPPSFERHELEERYNQLCSLAPMQEALRALRARAEKNTQ